MSDPKPNQPNFDLIQAVQRARLQHDAQVAPSQVSGVYWIECKRQVDGPAPTARIGRWVLSTDLAHVDTLWAQVKAATERGQLGYKCKVATVSRTADPQARFIQVMTYDADDRADVQRVGDALVALGISAPLHFERVHDEPA